MDTGIWGYSLRNAVDEAEWNSGLVLRQSWGSNQERKLCWRNQERKPGAHVFFDHNGFRLLKRHFQLALWANHRREWVLVDYDSSVEECLNRHQISRRNDQYWFKINLNKECNPMHGVVSGWLWHPMDSRTVVMAIQLPEGFGGCRNFTGSNGVCPFGEWILTWPMANRFNFLRLHI